jgi:hypothetical protein
MAAKKKKTRAETNIKWIEDHCRIPEGRDVGKPVKLRSFQKKILFKIYDTSFWHAPCDYFGGTQERQRRPYRLSCFCAPLRSRGEAEFAAILGSSPIAGSSVVIVFAGCKICADVTDVEQRCGHQGTASLFA